MGNKIQLLGATLSGTYGAKAHNTHFLGKYTAIKSGIINELHIYSVKNGYAKVNIYNDNNNKPGNLLASNNTGQYCTENQWNIFSISNVNIIAGNNYWIGAIGSISEGFSCLSSRFPQTSIMIYDVKTYTSFVPPNPWSETFPSFEDPTQLLYRAYGYEEVIISNIDNDNIIYSGQINATLSGHGFEPYKGIGKLELCNNINYNSATIKVTQNNVSWNSTGMLFNPVKGSLVSEQVWAFVTTDSGIINTTGYPVTLIALPIIFGIGEDNIIEENELNVLLTGNNLGLINGNLKLCNNQYYDSATIIVDQVITQWSNSQLHFNVVSGELLNGIIYAFVEASNGRMNSIGFEINLNAMIPSITNIDGDNKIYFLQAGVPVYGNNFESTQGNGYLEFCDNDDYSLATIHVVQSTIDVWSDNTIGIDEVSKGALSFGIVYVFVTTNSGLRNTIGFPIVLQNKPFDLTLDVNGDGFIFEGEVDLIEVYPPDETIYTKIGSDSNDSNLITCEMIYLEIYEEVKTEEWILDKYHEGLNVSWGSEELRNGSEIINPNWPTTGSYVEQLIPIENLPLKSVNGIDTIVEIPINFYSWGNNNGVIPLFMTQNAQTGIWEYQWNGMTILSKQNFNFIIPSGVGITGVRMYAKFDNVDLKTGSNSKYTIWDDIETLKASVNFIRIPKEYKEIFKHIVMQTKPVRSWAVLAIEWI